MGYKYFLPESVYLLQHLVNCFNQEWFRCPSRYASHSAPSGLHFTSPSTSEYILHLTDYCRSVTIVTKTKTTFFTRKIGQLHPKTGQFRHFLAVKNVVNFSNSSRQYSVNGNSTVNTGFWQFCWFLGDIFVKITPKFFKKLQNDLWHAKVIV